MADLLFEFPGAPPAGGEADLLFGDTTGGGGAAIGIAINAVVSLLATIAVSASEAPPLAALTDLSWDAGEGLRHARAALVWAPPPQAALSASAHLPWGEFVGAPAAVPASLPWSSFEGAPLPVYAPTPWGRAAAVAPRAAALPWGAAGLRVEGSVLPWQDAEPRPDTRALPWGAALPVGSLNRRLPGDAEFGMRPRPGPVNLHFCVPADSASLDLVLGRENCLARPRIADGLFITSRSSYVHTHSLAAYRLPDLTPVPFYRFTLSADDASFGWTLQLTGPVDLLSMLAPVAGVPQGLRLVLDGMTWDTVVEGLQRNRTFGSTEASVTARSATILLDSPYSPETSYLNAVPMTAQQVVDEALVFASATLDWRCVDWTLPAGVWSFRGTPLAVARRVAESIGAVVQSHRQLDQLIIRPRYPVLPWDWATADPDVTLPLGVAVSEGYRRSDKPAYEGVYLSGLTQGVLALVKRAGTAPSLLMPTETDPLLVDLEACRQRGEARLGAAGPGAVMTLSLPVLTGPSEPGVIDPGKLIAVEDPAGSWRGQSTGVTVSGNSEQIRQTLTIERHL